MQPQPSKNLEPTWQWFHTAPPHLKPIVHVPSPPAASPPTAKTDPTRFLPIYPTTHPQLKPILRYGARRTQTTQCRRAEMSRREPVALPWAKMQPHRIHTMAPRPHLSPSTSFSSLPLTPPPIASPSTRYAQDEQEKAIQEVTGRQHRHHADLS